MSAGEQAAPSWGSQAAPPYLLEPPTAPCSFALTLSLHSRSHSSVQAQGTGGKRDLGQSQSAGGHELSTENISPPVSRFWEQPALGMALSTENSLFCLDLQSHAKIVSIIPEAGSLGWQEQAALLPGSLGTDRARDGVRGARLGPTLVPLALGAAGGHCPITPVLLSVLLWLENAGEDAPMYTHVLLFTILAMCPPIFTLNFHYSIFYIIL